MAIALAMARHVVAVPAQFLQRRWPHLAGWPLYTVFHSLMASADGAAALGRSVVSGGIVSRQSAGICPDAMQRRMHFDISPRRMRVPPVCTPAGGRMRLALAPCLPGLSRPRGDYHAALNRYPRAASAMPVPSCSPFSAHGEEAVVGR